MPEVGLEHKPDRLSIWVSEQLRRIDAEKAMSPTLICCWHQTILLAITQPIKPT